MIIIQGNVLILQGERYRCKVIHVREFCQSAKVFRPAFKLCDYIFAATAKQRKIEYSDIMNSHLCLIIFILPLRNEISP